jgi:hypothetical protein
MNKKLFKEEPTINSYIKSKFVKRFGDGKIMIGGKAVSIKEFVNLKKESPSKNDYDTMRSKNTK